MAELVVASGLLVATLIPFAYSTVNERRLARACYQRVVAMEIVDGETEVLLAGGWRAWTPGTHAYPVQAGAATNLPPGRFQLTLQPHRLRLEWEPALKGHGGPVVREVTLP
jgi:hypothetical protein